jgi:hypothetical protein
VVFGATVGQVFACLATIHRFGEKFLWPFLSPKSPKFVLKVPMLMWENAFPLFSLVCPAIATLG